jgi:hypothetical protein
VAKDLTFLDAVEGVELDSIIKSGGTGANAKRLAHDRIGNQLKRADTLD